MGQIISSLLKKFECKSSCSMNHELHEDIVNKKICFNSLDLKRSDIILLNKIISKRKIIKDNQDNQDNLDI